MTIFVPELICRKRDGMPLKAEEIKTLIHQYTAGQVPDYQMASMLMAVFFSGLNDAELSAWTEAMLRSGAVLTHSPTDGCKVDKHSTGGVGDKVSLCLAPAVAACGVVVPMIAGRGLGHTGGTLDKLEAIDGFRVDLTIEQALAQLERIGLFLMGQTDEIAPADRQLYALRDVTGTVESIPLIASSIMSKKLAEGIDALVLDVKVGAGAFMQKLDQAQALARTLIAIGQRAGVRVRALLTNMDRPLGRTVGNALETAEAIAVMQGQGPADVIELTEALGAEMVVLGGQAATEEQGRQAVRRALTDGTALERFGRLVEAQGGDADICADPARLGQAKNVVPVHATADGIVAKIHPKKVALAALEVDAGRRVIEDNIDPLTGVRLLVELNEVVTVGQPLAELHVNDQAKERSLALLSGAFEIADQPLDQQPLIIARH